ncbi:unnamed protein product, partial [Staurois parvus]
MWVDQRVNCVLFYCVVCVCFTVSTLLSMALLCKAMHSSVQKLTGEKFVLFTYTLPTRKCKI